MTRAFITGCGSTSLSADEEAFVARARPWGLILFARNVDTPAQVSALAARFRELTEREDAPVLVDQEGGRVQRLCPPHWRRYPPASAYARLYAMDRLAALKATRQVHQLMASELAACGVNVNCLPVLDVPQPDSHGIIGDRAYGTTPEEVTVLARAAMQGLVAAGVLPVIKHIPGHGRARADSHMELPRVDTALDILEGIDLFPFAALADAPMAMTAHVVYTVIDSGNPATLSARLIGDVIRDRLGFDGLLMSDDLSMKALAGDMGERAAAAIEAGCDVALHCNGDMDEMRAVAGSVPELQGDAARRAEMALAMLRPAAPFDEMAAQEALSRLVPQA